MGKLARVHIIAISKTQNKYNELDMYAYAGGKISKYSPQWEWDEKWDYSEKIKEIAFAVDDDKLDWVDLYIEDGQELTRKGSSIYVDGQEVEPFRRISDNQFANIGPVTSKIFNEFLRSREKGDFDLRDILKETFEEGMFANQISDIIEQNFHHIVEVEDLNNLDKQIIVRVKIESYNFIVNFIKNILHSGLDERVEFCEIFLNRVFMLESQNFIKV